MSTTPADLPHPTQINIPKETLERDYLYVHVDRCPDTAWQFKLNLHRDTRIAPDGRVAPTVADPFQTLALFQRPEPLADIEVFGLHLPIEIDPADWLDLWLERHGLEVASTKRFPTPRGVVGDSVCRWDTPDGPFAGRFVSLRWGRRLFLLALRTPRENYARIADDFFTAVVSFNPVEVDEQALAGEPWKAMTVATPLPVTVAAPASYAMKQAMSDADATAVIGDQLAVPDLPDDPVFGKLAFIVAKASMADHPAKAAQFYMDALLQNPVTLHGSEFEEEAQPPAGFLQSWLLTAPATLTPPDADPLPCEVRCRVMAREDVWLVAGVLGPARHVAPIAWMRNKRALDVVGQGVRF
jgi:hypothetical protein